jgi:dTDP-glucose 4,6-dehydratase
MQTARELISEDCQKALTPQLARLGNLKNSTLVVSGGTGFLGKWIAEVVGILNDSYGFGIECHLVGRNIPQFKSECPYLAARKDIVLKRDDVRYLSELPQKTSWVVHAASTPDNREHASHPTEVMSAIAEGTANVLRVAARLSELRMFLNVSSGLIYGSQPLDLDRIPESSLGSLNCSEPAAAYAEAKRFGETLCSAARTQSHVPTATVRPFSFVGPYHSLETTWAINNFLRDGLKGNSIRVLGNGKTVRSYMYAADFAVWILTILVNTKAGRTYNVGSATPMTIEEVAHMVAVRFSPRPEVVVGSSMNAYPNVSRFVPDTTAARADFGLQCTYTADEAIERTIAWHRASKS